ncbi:AAC(3) family N-acetyltransferase [Paenibacillus aurantius]|uniref:Aminoglycoside N(3)-acetyltransferase n=1 Tax=Paenibacillus aurantius TaxID=2918900 RepID=A0AA96LCK4_9BACL|nr:AAC(3) family N-acetyltransferase [Paenibacillus aurantius]WNQ11242.1 AAC(3) family N-acetyltransferase [Paenibacillus aurantius]
MKINESSWPVTVSSLASDLRRLGVAAGMTLLVHSSLKSLNRWVIGGPHAVVLALEEALGPGGTLVMPTHSSDLSDPAHWQNPPVPESWWSPIREEMPPFEPDLTPTRAMGAVVECFRKQNGTLRSSHPQVSFAARGPKAAFLTGDHSLPDGLGERSPLARLYEAEGWVLLLGVGHENNTSLHLSEHRTVYPGKKKVAQGAPCLVGGKREWVTYEDLAYDSDDFGALGQAFEEETGLVRRGTAGDAILRLMPQRDLVDFGVGWMERRRGQG